VTPAQLKLKEKICNLIEQSGYLGIEIEEILSENTSASEQTQSIVQMLIDTGEIVRLPSGLFFSIAIIEKYKMELQRLFATEASLSVGRFRDYFQISRKQAVPVLEYFDSIGLTRRVQDTRILLK
jgi:selenocysteine-specific elongation factor